MAVEDVAVVVHPGVAAVAMAHRTAVAVEVTAMGRQHIHLVEGKFAVLQWYTLRRTPGMD